MTDWVGMKNGTTGRVRAKTAVGVLGLALAAGGLLLPGWSVPAEAQTRAARPKTPAQVTITNGREVILTNFEILPAHGGRAVATLKTPLTPGKAVKLRLTRASGCAFVATGLFEDGSDFVPANVDLCKDATIRLVE